MHFSWLWHNYDVITEFVILSVVCLVTVHTKVYFDTKHPVYTLQTFFRKFRLQQPPWLDASQNIPWSGLRVMCSHPCHRVHQCYNEIQLRMNSIHILGKPIFIIYLSSKCRDPKMIFGLIALIGLIMISVQEIWEKIMFHWSNL